MRWLYGLALVVSLWACGGDSNTGPAAEGTIAVQFDPASCNAGNAEIFIDGTSQGAYFWLPGQARSWTVDAGSHTVGAREVGGSGLIWASQNTNVQANATQTIVFTC